MRYPKFLQDGQRIGFIAPSFGCSTGVYRWRFDKALENLSDAGYKTVLGPNVYAAEGIGISNTPIKCAEEANDFLLNDKSDVIISCGGGELMCEILPFVKFDKIANSNPKWFVGYSDNTNLTFLLNTLCDTAAVYGPNAGAYMSREVIKESYRYIMSRSDKKVDKIDKLANTMNLMAQNTLDLICGKKLTFCNYDKWYEEYKLSDNELGLPNSENETDEQVNFSDFTEHEHKHFLYRGDKEVSTLEFEGRIIGGCLDCLTGLVGTRFDRVKEFVKRYENDGIIWFMESCDLNVMSQTRSYWTLENAGWFENVKAFIIGRPLRFEDSFDDFDHYKAALFSLSKYNVPIILDADIGHLPPQMPIMSGAYAKVSADSGKLGITYELK